MRATLRHEIFARPALHAGREINLLRRDSRARARYQWISVRVQACGFVGGAQSPTPPLNGVKALAPIE